MAAALYSTCVPDVKAYAVGAPDATIVDALRKTAIAFFWSSLAYRKWLPAFDLTLSTTTYTPTLPSQTEIAQVTALYCQGLPVDEKTHEQFLALDPKWPSLTGTQAQYFTVLDDKSTFNIIPIPQATVVGAFTMQVALCPTLTSTGVEQAWLEEWRDGIIDGALARLLTLPERSWTNLKEADKRHERYHAQKAAARAQGNKGNVRADLTVQMRRWV